MELEVRVHAYRKSIRGLPFFCESLENASLNDCLCKYLWILQKIIYDSIFSCNLYSCYSIIYKLVTPKAIREDVAMEQVLLQEMVSKDILQVLQDAFSINALELFEAFAAVVPGVAVHLVSSEEGNAEKFPYAPLS